MGTDRAQGAPGPPVSLNPHPTLVRYGTDSQHGSTCDDTTCAGNRAALWNHIEVLRKARMQSFTAVCSLFLRIFIIKAIR